MKKKVYVIAKVSGLPYDQVKEKYGRARKAIERSGKYEAIIPTDFVSMYADWHVAMKIAIPLLCSCDLYTWIDPPHTTAGGLIEELMAGILKIPYISLSEF
jgi:hypothetical protein